MARIDLSIRIETSDLEEGADILTRLKGVKLTPMYGGGETANEVVAYAEMTDEQAKEYQATEKAYDAPQTRKGRGPNKPKDPQPEAPAASAAVEPEKQEASSASTAQTDSTSDVGVEKVRELLSKFVSTEGRSMVGAQDIMREHFTTAAGEPVKRLTDLQPKDYGRCAQIFAAELGL
jgi:hypothetical protein